jgi:hypothetical protein
MESHRERLRLPIGLHIRGVRYVRHVFPTGICWADFITRGGVSVAMTELTLI